MPDTLKVTDPTRTGNTDQLEPKESGGNDESIMHGFSCLFVNEGICHRTPAVLDPHSVHPSKSMQCIMHVRPFSAGVDL